MPSFKGKLKENVLLGKTKKKNPPTLNCLPMYRYCFPILSWQDLVKCKIQSSNCGSQDSEAYVTFRRTFLLTPAPEIYFDFKVNEMQAYEKTAVFVMFSSEPSLMSRQERRKAVGKSLPLFFHHLQTVRQRVFSLHPHLHHLSWLCKSYAWSSTLSTGCLFLAISNSFSHLQSSWSYSTGNNKLNILEEESAPF